MPILTTDTNIISNTFTLACKHFSPDRSWLGSWSDIKGWGSCNWIDAYMALMFGGIPWQVYFQRVLSSDTGLTQIFLWTFFDDFYLSTSCQNVEFLCCRGVYFDVNSSYFNRCHRQSYRLESN